MKKGWKHKFYEYLMFAPDLFHLLCKLTFDDEIPKQGKYKWALEITYFISSVDAISEMLVGWGVYIDDIVVAFYVLNDIINKTHEGVVTKHWAGDEEVLKVIQKY